MERTASRPPPSGGANWAVFFAPLAVTAVVIIGAMVFVWVSDPEPADRPEVERLDLREVEPEVETRRFASVKGPRDTESQASNEAVREEPRIGLAREIASDAPASEPGNHARATASGDDEGDFEDDDEDFVDMTSDIERTPEERQAAKARLMDSVAKVPFMAPMMERVLQRREDRAGEAAGEAASKVPSENGVPEGEIQLDQGAPSGAAGAAGL